jgi:hypothetical protein
MLAAPSDFIVVYLSIYLSIYLSYGQTHAYGIFSHPPHFCFFQPTAKDSFELEWTESLLPTSYISEHGPPQIAAIGRKHGRSLAVASSSGLLILDINSGNVNNLSSRVHKWRLFGTETEERAFKVLSMTWWEGAAVQGPEYESDDLLVAIVQSNSGQQYLSCWSPKRYVELEFSSLRVDVIVRIDIVI